ncbi:N-methyl-L-tryptophan oxidase [Amycolatopsis sp. NPDC059027]|uniref:N-methyl-L-tryptophan oxidase n=1 Tax=Amycolatopsis sp. NPDC059027 TaxID=3346709 RepID=UPI00366A6DA9
MTRQDADVLVIGLGAWGSAALWRLRQRGVDVIGVERHGIGHAFGSSHGGSRMFRITCLEHPGLVPLARRSLALWRELETTAGSHLFHPVGGLLIGPEDGKTVGGTLRAAAEHGVDVERLAAADLRARYPQHTGLHPDHIGVWEPSAGILRPEAAVRAAVRLAEAGGARIHPHTTVTGIELIPGGVLVHTPARTFRTGQVVVTAGAWLPTLVPGLPLDAIRMPINWFAPDGDREPFALHRFPVFMRQLDDGRVLWGNGREGEHEVKLGLEDGGDDPRPFDLDGEDRSVSASDWQALTPLLPEVLPGLDPVPAKVAVCMFSRTPDGQFVLGRPRRDPRLVIAGGCNAHGAKHATGIGDVLADLVLGRDPVCALGFTDPNRFG